MSSSGRYRHESLMAIEMIIRLILQNKFSWFSTNNWFFKPQFWINSDRKNYKKEEKQKKRNIPQKKNKVKKKKQ